MKRQIVLGIVFPLLCCAPVKKRAGESASLYRSYKDFFPIGTAVNPDVDFVSDTRKKFLVSQYNSLTPENQMKPRQIHPEEKVFNWSPADKIVQFARENNMKIRGHALVWFQNVPGWMIRQKGKMASKDYLFDKMKEHITAVMSRYKENVYCWDVVNEAVSDNRDEYFRPRDSLFLIAGEEYVERAFRYAREADPDALLFYNDYRFSNPVKRKKIYELLKRLKEKGVPVDGVGLQSHYVPGEISEAYLQETIDMFSGLGLKIQVTELDVSVYNYRVNNGNKKAPEDDSYSAQRQRQQAETYEMLFKVYRRNRGKITGVTFWGSSDRRDNYRTRKIGKMDYPFLFDESLKPKPVFYKIINY